MKIRSRSQLAIALPYLAILAGIIAINWVIFRYLFHQNYLVWYITNGTVIGIVVSFLASIWEGLDDRVKLLSAHPGWYLQGCFGLMAAFFASISVSWERDPEIRENGINHDLNDKFNFGFDGLFRFILLLVITILVLAWLIIIAPLNYFLTIFTGSIARRQLLGIYKRAFIIVKDDRMSWSSISRREKLPEGAVEVSLAGKPFATTQAVTALVLFVANRLILA